MKKIIYIPLALLLSIVLYLTYFFISPLFFQFQVCNKTDHPLYMSLRDEFSSLYDVFSLGKDADYYSSRNYLFNVKAHSCSKRMHIPPLTRGYSLSAGVLIDDSLIDCTRLGSDTHREQKLSFGKYSFNVVSLDMMEGRHCNIKGQLAKQ